MHSLARLLPLVLTLWLPQGLVQSQTNANDTSAGRHERFWNSFERELDVFVRNLTSGFLPGARSDSVRPGSHDAEFGVAADVPGEDDEVALSFSNHDRRDETMFVRHGARMPPPWLSENTLTDKIVFRYNRVEGLFLGLGSRKRYLWDGRKMFSPYGSIGYGFTSHRWRGNLGIARQFLLPGEGVEQMIETGLEGYSLTDTKDQWRIGPGENTAAAFLIHEDFRDYFSREGVTLHAAYLLRGDHLFAEARLSYLVDQYGSLARKTEWSLFGGGKRFRANPEIDDGAMRSVQALSGLSTATRGMCGPEGWNVGATAEFADRRTFGGEFTFRQYIADIRRYQPVGDLQALNLRVRIGTGHGVIPRQRSFETGGLGTLPAFPFKAFPGDSLGANRMILVNAEYVVYGDLLGDLAFWPSWIMKHVNFLLLTDGGLVRSVAPATTELGGFGGATWKEFRHDLGVGISNRQGTVRFAVVWRTDRSEPATFTFRFGAPF